MKDQKPARTEMKKFYLKNKNILVTGGSGFIGSHLVDRLISEKPLNIIVVDRSIKSKLLNLENAKRNFPHLKTIEIDISNYGKTKDIFKKNQIDVVFHLAVLPLFESLIYPKRVVLTNIKTTVNLLELQRKHFFKTLVMLSSSEAYGTARHFPMGENHPLYPTTPYAASKAAADLIALSYYQTFGNDLAIIRPFNNYGPRQNPNSKGVVTSVIFSLLSNKNPVVYGTGKQTRDFVFVKDTVKGIVDAYKYPATRGQVINLGSGKMVEIKELISKLIKISGKKLNIDFDKARVADVKNHNADINLAKRLINWEPEVDLDDGLRETYYWYKRNAKEI